MPRAAGVAGVPGIDVGDRDQVAVVAPQADHVVGIGLLGELCEVGPLVPPLDGQERPLRGHADEQPAGAGQGGVEHAPPELPLESEEHRPHELQERGLARLVGAVQHLHAGAEAIDHDAIEGAEPFDVDAFDEHPDWSPRVRRMEGGLRSFR